ncbi:MAG: cofactor-independent phosphoglycerate mutase [Desulfuromonas sp.]|nr:MAG: cofactor-independent phosphoglycerate mutase [Desulfuromonas sp.]
MKYVVLLGDGMSDEPVEALEGKTPLQAAATPNMDRLAQQGEIGLAQTVPEGFRPGSDVANLSVFGYDPRDCYTGRSPLEAASMGVELGPDDVAFRLNLVHLAPHGFDLYMGDFSAGHIGTDQARQLILSLQEELGDEQFTFHPGISYRHLLVWHGGKEALQTTPPHDITNQSVRNYLPQGDGADALIHLTTSAQMLLKRHPVNLKREDEGEVTANSIWLWGQGRPPAMQTYQQMLGLTGSVISAVDLIKGIGTYAGLKVIDVPGATGYLDTNYAGKASATIEALADTDFVYLHVEAPDEASHGGKLEDKLQAIEDFDAKIVGPVIEGLKQYGDFRVLVLPDHPTPLHLMTHTSDAVPYILYDSTGKVSGNGAKGYDEAQAKASGVIVDPGHELVRRMIES